MYSHGKISRATQYLLLAAGALLFSVSTGPIVRYIQTGVLEFTPRAVTYYGPVAAFGVAAYVLFGLGLVYTSIRSLLKP